MDVKTEEITDRERAELRFTKEGLKTILSLASEIGELLQLDEAHVAALKRRKLKKAYAQSYDYLLSYNGGSMFICTISDRNKSSETTSIIIGRLTSLRNQYARVFLNPSRILNALIKCEKADNDLAAVLDTGLASYAIKRIGVATTTGNSFFNGRAYLVLDVDGREQIIENNQILDADFSALADPKALTAYLRKKSRYIYRGHGRALSIPFINEGVTLISRENM
jgi:DNA-binding CsgD family transcriptional regulator